MDRAVGKKDKSFQVFNIEDQDNDVREVRQGNLFGQKSNKLSFARDYSLILQIPVNVYNEKKSCWAWGYTG